MTTTITGKNSATLHKEIADLYVSYVTTDELAIRKEHAAATDTFSKLIMLYVARIETYKQAIEAHNLDFYRAYMSIKVLQLVYLTWKSKRDTSHPPTYSYPELPGIKVQPGVFSPEHATDSYLWAKYIERAGIVRGKEVLEMGAGSGIMSMYLSLFAEPKRVVAADVSRLAIENMKLNVDKLGIDPQRFTVLESDLYAGFNAIAKFDVIFWAFVWLQLEDPAMIAIFENEPEGVVMRLLSSVIDPHYAMLEQFLAASKTRLSRGGSILLITTDFIRNDKVKVMAESLGYSFRVDKFTEASEVVKGSNMIIDLYQITLSI